MMSKRIEKVRKQGVSLLRPRGGNLIGFSRKVAELGKRYYLPETYTVRFDASNLPSGMYIYQLRGNDVMISKKMILIK